MGSVMRTRGSPSVARTSGARRRVRPGSAPPKGPKSELAHGQLSPRKAAVQAAPAKSYEPTAYEQSLTTAHRARTKAKPPAPRLKVSEKDGVATLSADHPEQSIAYLRLLEATGSNDFDFLDGLLKQLCNAGSTGRSVDEDALNFMLAMVKGVEPRDQVEAMLAA